MTETITFKKGDSVTYCPAYGAKEKGVVKEVREDIAFVVYKCNGEWHRYEEYTGAATNISDLKPEWVARNRQPEDIFSASELEKWAESEGYVKK